MNEKIELHRCAYRLDYLNRLPERLRNDYHVRHLFLYHEENTCKCPKRTFKFKVYRQYPYNGYIYVDVCRNYFAELINRFSKGEYVTFESLSEAKWYIVCEALGFHFLPNLIRPIGFKKVTDFENYGHWTNRNGIQFPFIFYHRSGGWSSLFNPHLEVLLDDHCYVTYSLDNVLDVIYSMGIENCKEYISTDNLLEVLADVAKDILFHIENTRGLKAQLKDEKFINSLKRLGYNHNKYYGKYGLQTLSADMIDFILSIINRVRKADYKRLKI